MYGVQDVYTADVYHALGLFLVKTGTYGEAKRGVDLSTKGLGIRQRGAGSLGQDDSLVWNVEGCAALVQEARAELAIMEGVRK